MARLEECFERLVRLARRESDPRIGDVVEDARRYKESIDRSRNTLILANLGLVAHVARRFDAHRTPLVDLFQEGTIGLMTAVERFEWDRGCKFSTYAYWWVRQAISNALAQEATFIRLPDYARATLRRYRRAARELETSLGWAPDWQAIARRVGMSARRLHELISVSRQPFSLERATLDEDNRLQQMPDPQAPDPLQQALERELREIVAAALNGLEPREKAILSYRFGIHDDRTYTLEQIGRMLEISRERVRQIERDALRKILRATPRAVLPLH